MSPDPRGTVPLRHASRIADVAVERLDVVVVRIEKERGVVAGGIRSVARRTVGAKSGLDASAVEGVDLLARGCDKAQVQPCRRRLPVDDVDPRKAHNSFGFGVFAPGRNAEGRQDSGVKTHACVEVAGVNLNVIDDVLRPVPSLFAHRGKSGTVTEKTAVPACGNVTRPP